MELSQDSIPQESMPPTGTDCAVKSEAHRFAVTEGLVPVQDRRSRALGKSDGVALEDRRVAPDRRHEPRFPMSGSVRVGWVGPDHQMRYLTARGRDISEEGLGLWTSEELPLGALVNVDLCGCGMSALARVRYRRPADSGWSVGLQVMKSFPSDAVGL
jgi:hypothetical protein